MMMKSKWDRLMVAALGLFLLSGCVSTGKYRNLEEQASKDQAEFKNEITALQSEKNRLEQEKMQAESDIRDLNAHLIDLERQAAAISAQKDEEINRLKGTYDNLVKDLKNEIEKGEIKVTQMQNRLTVNLVEKILFDSGRAEVKPEGKTVLQKVGNILNSVKDKEIRIEGHTDNVPIGGVLQQRFPTNWELSTQRATNVLRFLQDKVGIKGERLSAVGYGEFRPISSNETPEGRSENRRIEIVLIPMGIKGGL
jgi:chemotaxis protein MotB